VVFSSSRYDHINPIHRQLHWLKAPERIDYKLALLVYKCLKGVVPSYLNDNMLWTLWTLRVIMDTLIVVFTYLLTYSE